MAQFHFNEHIFKLEQEEYASEGITVEHIEFTDNQACLDLLEMKSTGIFSMIDEEISVPRGSDDGFRSKLMVKHSKVCCARGVRLVGVGAMLRCESTARAVCA